MCFIGRSDDDVISLTLWICSGQFRLCLPEAQLWICAGKDVCLKKLTDESHPKFDESHLFSS